LRELCLLSLKDPDPPGQPLELVLLAQPSRPGFGRGGLGASAETAIRLAPSIARAEYLFLILPRVFYHAGSRGPESAAYHL